MNLDDLTRELESHAAQTPSSLQGQARLVGVRHRIRIRRRRQAGAVAGLAALAVASIMLVPGLAGRQADRPEVPATTVRPSDPLAFAADLAGDPLLVRAVSEPGARELVLRFTPTDTNLALSDFCRRPGQVPTTGAEPTPVTAQTSVNGHELTGNDCGAEGRANDSLMSFGDDPVASRARWAGFGVVPGRESVIRMTTKVADGQSPDLSRIQLGVGLYVLSGERVEDGGVRIKVLADSDGHRYRLAGHRTARATAERRSLSMAVPAGDHPVLVLYGNPGDPDAGSSGASASLVVDGEILSANSGGGTGLNPLDDAEAHTVELRLDKGLKGTMVLGYYVRVD